MSQPATNAFETWVQWEGGLQARLHGSDASPLSAGALDWEAGPGKGWTPEALLTGAVEVSVMLAFLESARRQGIRPLFYQSSAQGRVVTEPGGVERLTDLIIRPRVGVQREQEVAAVEVLFDRLPALCQLGQMLKAPPRIQPVIELWSPSRPPAVGCAPQSSMPMAF